MSIVIQIQAPFMQRAHDPEFLHVVFTSTRTLKKYIRFPREGRNTVDETAHCRGYSFEQFLSSFEGTK